MGRANDILDAARRGDLELVRRTLERMNRKIGPFSSFRRGPGINVQDVNGYTPLHHACLNGHTHIVRLLLMNNAHVDVPDIRGSRPLYLAAWAGHHEIVKILLMNPNVPANPNAQTIDNDTALHSAAQHGHNIVLAVLLSYGADPTIRNNSFQTPLDLAAQFGRLQAVQLLIRTHPELIEPYKVDNNFISSSKFELTETTPIKHIFTHTCLHLASRNGHKKVVEALLAAGMDVNLLTHGGTALHQAALCGKRSVVCTLLNAGVDIDIKDGNDKTALDLLRDYPPHVTYEIVTVIEDFQKRKEINNNHFSESDSDTIIEEPIDTEINHESMFCPIKSKSQSTKNLSNNHSMTSKVCDFGLSNSLNSLNADNSRNKGRYLLMLPITKPKSADVINNETPKHNLMVFRPINYENSYVPYLSDNTKKWTSSDDVGTQPHKMQANGSPISNDNNADNLQKSIRVSDRNGNSPYRCIDEYVKMSMPENETNFQIDKEYSFRKQFAGINSNWDDVNHAKHSPTPDFPPPSVTQAESTILEFMHPPKLYTSNKPKKRRSIHMNYNESLLDAFDEVNETEDFNFDFDSSLLNATPTSGLSDHVEEFVGDAPFAGLFKGSTLNLTTDSNQKFNAIEDVPDGLRSPNMVRSVKMMLSKQNNPPEKTEEFNATKVWDEINTILESIGSEILTDDVSIENKDETLEPAFKNEPCDMETVPATTTVSIVAPKAIKIREPTDLLLSISNNSTAKWCHSVNTLIHDQVTYNVYYLGSTVIRELQGTVSTRKSIQKLKLGEEYVETSPPRNGGERGLLEGCSNSTKFLKASTQKTRLKVGIALSYAGVRFIDIDEKSTICIHDIENINCVCQDADDWRYFAYITKELELHYCHVFMVDSLDLANEIILTLGQCFEVAYQMAVVKSA